VTAWFEADQDALALQAELIRICATFDHGILPAGLARGEDLAAKILEMAGDHCVEVEIRRPLERLYAKAVR
jgi:hypothetical protein